MHISLLVGLCPFGRAHADVPKGDLDASSGKLSGASADDIVIIGSDIYPRGTTEQYPLFSDNEGNTLSNTAHDYAECSSKGMCDRASGECTCFLGFDGSACQRLSCPSNPSGLCSGNGRCRTAKELAESDYGNIYQLWDQDTSMGCDCDAGYSSSDCSEKICKYGADPIYYESSPNVRYSNWTYQIYTNMNSGYGINV